MSSSLYAGVRALKYPSYGNFAFLGLVLGISFYMRLGIFYAFVIWPYFLPLIKERDLFKKVFLTILIYILIAAPGVLSLLNFSNGVWQASISKTVLQKEFTDNHQIVVNVLRNFMLFYHNYDYYYNHFIEGPYLDIVSRIFAFVGTIIVLLKTKKKDYLYFLLAYISICISIGITSPYSYTATTRGIFLMPFGFVFAAIGFTYLIKRARNSNVFFSTVVAFLFLIVIITINVYQSQIGVFKKVGFSGTALIIKSLQDANGSRYNTVLLLLSQYNQYQIFNQLDLMKEAYGLTDVKFGIIRGSPISCSQIAHSNVLYFQNDINVRDTLSKINCSDYRLTMLNPTMFP